jgi:hypothetical protein
MAVTAVLEDRLPDGFLRALEHEVDS